MSVKSTTKPVTVADYLSLDTVMDNMIVTGIKESKRRIVFRKFRNAVKAVFQPYKEEYDESIAAYEKVSEPLKPLVGKKVDELDDQEKKVLEKVQKEQAKVIKEREKLFAQTIEKPVKKVLTENEVFLLKVATKEGHVAIEALTLKEQDELLSLLAK